MFFSSLGKKIVRRFVQIFWRKWRQGELCDVPRSTPEKLYKELAKLQLKMDNLVQRIRLLQEEHATTASATTGDVGAAPATYRDAILQGLTPPRTSFKQ
jgi:hypothetical protein